MVGGLVANSCLTLVTPWTVACQAALSIGFLGQESWSGLPFPSPGDLPTPGIELRSLTLQADSLLSETAGNPWFPGFFPEKSMRKAFYMLKQKDLFQYN